MKRTHEPFTRMSEKPKKPEVLNTQTLAQTRLFRIEQVDLRFSNGVEVQYERLKGSRASGGAVLVIPMLDAETVLLIREYAAGIESYELALPKGLIEVDEDALNAANRELMEEVGYASNKLTHLTSLSLAPGYLGHVTQVVLAEELYPQRLQGDEPEAIEVVPWSIHRLHELVQREDCTEARSIAALFMYREHLNHDR